MTRPAPLQPIPPSQDVTYATLGECLHEPPRNGEMASTVSRHPTSDPEKTARKNGSTRRGALCAIRKSVSRMAPRPPARQGVVTVLLACHRQVSGRPHSREAVKWHSHPISCMN